MKAIFAVEELSKKLQQLGAVVNRSASLEIQKFVRLEVVGQAATLTGHDPTGYLKTELVATESDVPFSVLIQYDHFSDIVSKLSGKDVTLTVDAGGNANIAAGRYRAALKTRNVAEYTQLPPFEGDIVLENISLAAFQTASKRILPIVPSNSDRHIATVGLLEIAAGGLKLVGTDGQCMGILSIPGDTGAAEKSVILPRPAFDNVGKLTGDKLTITEADNGFFFSTAKEVLYVGKIQGEFPPYKRIIPAESTSQIAIATESFKEALGRVVITSGESAVVRLNVTSGNMEISARDDSVGQSAEDVEVSTQGNDIVFLLNSKVLNNFIGEIKGLFHANLTVPEKVVDFSAEEGKFRFLQMPCAPPAPKAAEPEQPKEKKAKKEKAAKE